MLKNFVEGNLDSLKIKKLEKFVLISEPAQICGNNAILKQNYQYCQTVYCF